MRNIIKVVTLVGAFALSALAPAVYATEPCLDIPQIQFASWENYGWTLFDAKTNTPANVEQKDKFARGAINLAIAKWTANGKPTAAQCWYVGADDMYLGKNNIKPEGKYWQWQSNDSATCHGLSACKFSEQ